MEITPEIMSKEPKMPYDMAPIYAVIAFDTEYAYKNDEIKKEGDYFVISRNKILADTFFDIKIYNATYAYLCINYMDDEEDYIYHLEKKDDYFTIPEINFENPLLIFFMNGPFMIKTDGDKKLQKTQLMT